MKRVFNTEAQCSPQKHYMVRLDERLRTIKEQYVDCGSYFVINRGRQYGKTTTLRALAEYLKSDYIVLSMDFQEAGAADFADEAAFAKAFAEMLLEAFGDMGTDMEEDFIKPITCFTQERNVTLRGLFMQLSQMCRRSPKPVVLMIDEIDSAGNNQVFIDFLGNIRRYYINRDRRPTFYSVILAGVYDIKNLKLKLRPDDEHQFNSPWNIAVKFKISMDFSAEQIASMLSEYEEDHHTGMDVEAVSWEIYQYTSGYPYLVSAVCKILDEDLPQQKKCLPQDNLWSKAGIAEAVKFMLKEQIPLFDSMIKQLDIYKDLRIMIEEILYQGKKIPFSPAEKSINIGVMLGFLKEKNEHVVIANRIFEMYLLNLFIAEEAVRSEMFFYGQGSKNAFIRNAELDMKLVIEKFVEHFTDVYNDKDEKFIEKYGRKLFLLYLKPIINGTGHYYIEAQTRDARRTDVIVDYLGEQFIIELKIWHGNEYHERGEAQLLEYLEYYHLDKGYMLSFNFNKNKQIGTKEVCIGGRTIIEGVV